MDELIEQFKELYIEIHSLSENPETSGLYAVQMHIQQLSDRITIIGKFLERNGVDIAELQASINHGPQ